MSHFNRPLLHPTYTTAYLVPEPVQFNLLGATSSYTSMPPSAVVTTDLSELRQEIFKNDEAKRIVVKVRTESQDTEEHRASAYRAASEMFPDWERDRRALFLAIEAWGERTFMAIDVKSHDYDFATAHKNKTVLPVYVLRQSRKRKIWALIRRPREDESLATNLEGLHNVAGTPQRRSWRITTRVLYTPIPVNFV